MALVRWLVAVVILLGVPTSSFAAQMEAHIPYGSEEMHPSYKFLRVITINYENGGKLAELLSGKQMQIVFSADSETPGINKLIEKINANLEETSSKATVTDATVNYQATLLGRGKSATIEYNIVLIPAMTNFNLGTEPNRLIDSQWRGIKVSGPVIIDTKEYGQFDINNPESVVRVMVPQVYEEIKNTEAHQILNVELLDASGILHLPLSKWHFLFDPTAILAETKEYGYKGIGVVSYYSMGECKIGIDNCGDRSWKAEFTLDKEYSISAIESQDDATLSIEGYAQHRRFANIEIFSVTTENPEIGAITGEFPVSVIYGMAGMAGIGAIAILFISNRKLKRDEAQGMTQTGIDPSRLRTQATSTSAGGYQTNRGESYLDEGKSDDKSRMPV